MMRIIDPRGHARQAAETTPPAPRLATLGGQRVGVLVNEPGSALITNWEGMSLRLSDLLVARERAIAGPRAIKGQMSAPAPAELIEGLAEGSDAVVNGLGK